MAVPRASQPLRPTAPAVPGHPPPGACCCSVCTRTECPRRPQPGRRAGSRDSRPRREDSSPECGFCWEQAVQPGLRSQPWEAPCGHEADRGWKGPEGCEPLQAGAFQSVLSSLTSWKQWISRACGPTSSSHLEGLPPRSDSPLSKKLTCFAPWAVVQVPPLGSFKQASRPLPPHRQKSRLSQTVSGAQVPSPSQLLGSMAGFSSLRLGRRAPALPGWMAVRELGAVCVPGAGV